MDQYQGDAVPDEAVAQVGSTPTSGTRTSAVPASRSGGSRPQQRARHRYLVTPSEPTRNRLRRTSATTAPSGRTRSGAAGGTSSATSGVRATRSAGSPACLGERPACGVVLDPLRRGKFRALPEPHHVGGNDPTFGSQQGISSANSSDGRGVWWNSTMSSPIPATV